MTKEEQIAIEPKKYYPNDVNCYDALLHEVELVDKHPSDVWHDKSEEPKGDNWKILCLTDYNECWVDSSSNALFIYNTWHEYVDIEAVKMWAYLNDLLPKGHKV